MFRSDGSNGLVEHCSLQELVPQQFHHASGLKGHRFSILRVPHSPSSYVWQPGGYWLRFDPFVACGVRRRGRDHLILVSSKVSERIYEAIRLLGSVDDETQRHQRYIAVHQAYEAVVQNRDVDLSAIRHALTHPTICLTHAATIESLRSRFGGLIIDLRNYQHRKEFFLCLARMLIETDKALFNMLNQHWQQWGKIESSIVQLTNQLELPFRDITKGCTGGVRTSHACIDQ